MNYNYIFALFNFKVSTIINRYYYNFGQNYNWSIGHTCHVICSKIYIVA